MIIGITGGIGSGKSTVAAELRRLGYAVYDCDSEAKRIIVEDATVQAQLIDLLGSDIYEPDKENEGRLRYRTDIVAARVFSNASLLAGLNAIVHPAVQRDIERLTSDSASGLTSNSEAVFFIESAILYESGLDTLCDKVVLVTAPEDIRIARCIDRDYQGVAGEDNINKVRARIRAQKKDADISADIRLTNDGSESVASIAQRLLQLLNS